MTTVETWTLAVKALWQRQMPAEPSIAIHRYQPQQRQSVPWLTLSLKAIAGASPGLGEAVSVTPITPPRIQSLERSYGPVTAGNESFAGNVLYLGVSDLVTKDGLKTALSALDVSLSDVTDEENPVVFSLVDVPSGPGEFSVNRERGEVQFVDAPADGSVFSATFYVLFTSRSVQPFRLAGVALTEAWSNTPEQQALLEQIIVAATEESNQVKRDLGFLDWRLLSLGPAETVWLRLGEVDEWVYRQETATSFQFETMVETLHTSGEDIRRVELQLGVETHAAGTEYMTIR